MTHKTSILIVDDDNDLRKLLRLALDNGRRVIHEADTALGGLQLARQLSPDILLLDIGLPGNFDGFVLYQAMSREPALWHVRTVIISGHGALEDLTQEGYIGLLNAAQRFDPDRDIRFSTYARWWVRAQMTRAIDHTGRPVRLPGCAVEQTRNLRKAIKRFESLGADYSVSDLANEVGLDVERAEFLLSQGGTVSLDQPVDEGPRSRTLEQFLEDDSVDVPEDAAIRDQEIRRMQVAFEEVLSERHRYVLARRYGLEDSEFRTLSEVGRGMSLSRERVRQIEREALLRLREHARIREGVAPVADITL